MNTLPDQPYMDQLEREAQEAFRFTKMNDKEKHEWIKANFYPLLKAQADILSSIEIEPDVEQRYFSNLEEKNRYDDDRELQIAFQMHRSREKNARKNRPQPF